MALCQARHGQECLAPDYADHFEPTTPDVVVLQCTLWEQHGGQCICSVHCLLWITQGLSWALQAGIAEQGFEEIYRRFDSTPGNTISIQGQVHVAVRTLLAKYGVDRSQGAVTSITTTGAGLNSIIQNTLSILSLVPGLSLLA